MLINSARCGTDSTESGSLSEVNAPRVLAFAAGATLRSPLFQYSLYRLGIIQVLGEDKI